MIGIFIASRQEGRRYVTPVNIKVVLDGAKNNDTLDINSHIGG